MGICSRKARKFVGRIRTLAARLIMKRRQSASPAATQRIAVFRLTRHIGSKGKETSREPIAGRGIVRCGRNVQSPEIGTAEGACGHVSHRHLHHAVNLPVRSNPDNAASEESTVPEKSLRVDGRTVRQSAGKIFQEWSLVRYFSGLRIIVVCPNYICQRIP